MACLALLTTSFLFALIYWYHPYVNDRLRYPYTLILEASTFLMMLVVFAYTCNPYISYPVRAALESLIILMNVLIVAWGCSYPCYFLYMSLRRK